MLLKSLQGKNARHSFPSLDSAIGGCVVGILVGLNSISAILMIDNVVNDDGKSYAIYEYDDAIFLACLFSFFMAMFGRIYLFAHHFVDVIIGGFIGFIFPVLIKLYFTSRNNQITPIADNNNELSTTIFYLYGGICLTWLL